VLRNGEFVEILTSKNANPSRDWLNFVKTSKARSKIRSWLKEQQREESLLRGRELLEREARKANLDPKEILTPDKLDQVAKKYGVGNGDELLATIGFGRVTALQVLQKLVGKDALGTKLRKPLSTRKHRRGETKGVSIKGVDNLLVRFSKCCSPVPGDDIVGYITRGRGVSIHRTDCPNIAALSHDLARQIEVAWDNTESVSYPVEIEIEAVDRPNLLANIMNNIAESKTNIEAVNARTSRQEAASIQLVVDIHDVTHLTNVMNKLRQVEGVISVRRATPT
jgi:GTP pyrophosphokinase